MGVSSPKIIRIMRVIKSWLFFHALQCPHDVLYLLICYTPLPLKQNWEVVWCKFYPIITDQLKLSQSGKNGLVQVSYVTKLFILHSQLKVMALHILLQQQIITDFSQEKIPLSFTKIYTYVYVQILLPPAMTRSTHFKLEMCANSSSSENFYFSVQMTWTLSEF